MQRALLTIIAMAITTAAGADELADVTAIFKAAYANECYDAEGFAGSPAPDADVYTMTYRGSYDEADAEPRTLRLYRFYCTQGAYNTAHVFFSADDDDGIRLTHFAQPTYTVNYVPEPGQTTADQKVEDVVLTGMTAYARLVNSEVDAEQTTVSMITYWRGMGDASSSGVWRLIDGDFSLLTYDVDGSYDGEINPIRIVDYGDGAAKTLGK